MKKIIPGDVFAYAMEKESKYGLIQVVDKSDIGYNVRVFYDTINSLTSNAIFEIIGSTDFYYIRDFFEYTLLNESSDYIGNYKIPNHVKIPRYMRKSERKANGQLYWYIFDINKGTVIKTFNRFDDELRNLSPESTWGIEYIKKRWMEHFTLEKWDDNMENQWYIDYLKVYEPDKLKNLSYCCTDIKNNMPTKLWKSTGKFSSIVQEKIDKIVDNFANEISHNNLNKNQLTFIIERTIEDLNKINDIAFLIETEEREEILEFIVKVLTLNGYSNEVEGIDILRKW